MKNPNKKKLRVVLKSAILGALIFSAIVLTSAWIDHSTDPKTFHAWFIDLILGAFQAMTFFLSLPVECIMSFIGFKTSSNLFLEYIINALDGAIVFAFVAFCWQFILKRNHENEN